MALNIAGIVYTLIFLVFVSAQIICHPYIKKATNTYWFWLGVGVIYLIYVIVIAWARHINLYIHFDFPGGYPDPNKPDQSQIVSNALLLNICPFLNIALPVCLIADPSRKAARGFAPLAIIACGLVMLIDLPTAPYAEFSWQYVFLGALGQYNLYLMGHAVNCIIAVGVLLNTPKFGWKGMSFAYGQVALMYLYIGIMKTVSGCTCYTAGLSPDDFIVGNFSIFKILNLPSNVCMALFFLFLIILVGGTILLYDFCKRNKYSYGNKPNSCWWQWYDYNKFAYKNFWGNNLKFALNRSDRIWAHRK